MAGEVDFAEKVTETLGKLADTLALTKDVMKELQERFTALENRQEVLWEALQGITKHLSEKENIDGERN
jgi:hypothetical protein